MTYLRRDELNHRTVLSAAARLDGRPVRVRAGHPCSRHPGQTQRPAVNRGERQVLATSGRWSRCQTCWPSCCRGVRAPLRCSSASTAGAGRGNLHSLRSSRDAFRSRRRSHRRRCLASLVFRMVRRSDQGVLRPLRRDGLPLSYTPQPWIERGRSGSIVIPGGTEISRRRGRCCAKRAQPATGTVAVTTAPSPQDGLPTTVYGR